MSVGSEGTQLLDADGKLWRVGAGAQGSVLAGLDRCEVQVDGGRLGRKLLVQDWTLLSAPGGGQAFVGRLHLYGNNWIIDDRSTGSKVVVDMATVPDLAAHAGSLVLIMGFVSGAQTVQPMSWRVVAP